MNVLTEAIPAGITFAKVLPSDWKDYAPGARYASVPSLVTHQWHDAATAPLTYTTTQYLDFWGVSGNPSYSYYRMNEAVIGGDSSTPAFVFINGQTVVVTLWHYQFSGPDISQYINEINAAMTTLGGGYQLSIVSLGSFPRYQ